jgi:hypothetical protein
LLIASPATFPGKYRFGLSGMIHTGKLSARKYGALHRMRLRDLVLLLATCLLLSSCMTSRITNKHWNRKKEDCGCRLYQHPVRENMRECIVLSAW